jgi:DHA2 family multidrug resistance protein
MAEPLASLDQEAQTYSSTQRWIVLFAVMLGTLMMVIDSSIVNVAIPQMMGNLGATLQQISWVSTAYITANVIFLPLTGWFAGRFGYRNYLSTSIVIFTVASLMCGMSKSVGELVIFRILQGSSGAAMLSTAQATIFTVFPRKQQPMVQAIFGIGIMVGPTIGPTLGGWITDNYSWSWVFFINIPIGILATTLALNYMHRLRPGDVATRRVDIIGMLFLVMGLGCFQVMLEQGQSDDWFQSDFIVWMAVLAVVGMASFIYWELTYPEPAVDLRVLKDRALAAGTAFGTVMGFGLFGGIFILPIFLQDIRGYSAMQSGLIMLPGAIASAFMLPVSGRLMGKFPARSILFVSVLTFSFANFLLRRLTIDTGPGDMFWPLVIRGAALGLINVPLSLVSLSHLRGRNLPYGTALFNLMRQLGGSTGIAYLSSRVSAEIFVHRSALVAHVVASNNLTIGRLQLLTGAMVAQGMPLAVAKKQALAITDMTISQQASVMSYGSAFVFMAVTFLFLLPLLFLFHSDLHHEHRPVAHAAAE